jgi:uncharacterized membrane protein
VQNLSRPLKNGIRILLYKDLIIVTVLQWTILIQHWQKNVVKTIMTVINAVLAFINPVVFMGNEMH